MRVQKQDNLNEVYFEDVEGPGGGRHYYQVVRTVDEEKKQVLCEVQFQNGPRGEESSIPGVVKAIYLKLYSKGRKVKKSGNNLYPYNFNQLLDLMGIPQIEEMEEIQEIDEL